MAVIANAKLRKIDNDAIRSKQRYSSKDPFLVGFKYDHGNMLYEDSAGRVDILYLHEGDNMKYNATRLLHNLSPDTVIELARGYKIALNHGLLEASPPLAEGDEQGMVSRWAVKIGHDRMIAMVEDHRATLSAKPPSKRKPREHKREVA